MINIIVYGLEGKELLEMETNVLKSLNKGEKPFTFTKISNIEKISKKGIMLLPALEINGKIICEGVIPTVHELTNKYLK